MRIPHGLRAALAGQVSGGATDPYFNSVSLLIYGDGTNGSTAFVDSSSNNFTITPAGNAQISTTQSKFGGASMYFDGSGDYLQIGSSADFAFGTGDYTAEFFIYPLAITNQRAILDIGNSTWQIYNNSSGQILFYSGGDRIASSSSIANNIWYHIAITRSSNTTKLFINGQQDGSSYTDTTNYSGPYVFTVANRQDLALSGLSAFISNLRITKGVARYTSNYTPPTAAFPDA